MPLTAAEAMVLLEPAPDSGIPAAKVTLLALLAAGVLKQQPGPGDCSGTATRLVITRQPAENPPHVAAVLEAVRASKSATLADVASRLSIATNGFASFVAAGWFLSEAFGAHNVGWVLGGIGLLVIGGLIYRVRAARKRPAAAVAPTS